MNILWAVIWFLVLGLGFGTILAVAGKKFAVEVDERIEKINDILPGANCGGCGYTGCEAFAVNVVKGTAEMDACPIEGDAVVDKIAEIMGKPRKKSSIRYRAQVMCSGTKDLAKYKYKYVGIPDCISATRVAGGDKACPNGCLGLGTCMRYCKFDAIRMVNGVAAVDYEKCKACGMCAIGCPKNLIKLIPFNATHWVGCIPSGKGSATRKHCDIGCIVCKICEKKCPADAISITEYAAHVDYEKCTSCGACEISCPRSVIWSNMSQKYRGIVRDKEDVDHNHKG
jgi:RnfABCDGE-type electron transport complex B subunit